MEIEYTYSIVKKKKQTRFHKKIHHKVKLAFLPHRKNSYRPHLVRRQGLASVLVAVAMLLGGYNYAATGSVLGDKSAITSGGLLAATNKERVSHELTPLKINYDLSEAARLKAVDMLEKQYWDHTSPDGTQPWAWFDKVGYAYTDAGENLAKNFTTDGSVVAAWMASDSHRENILDSKYTEVGFGTIHGTLEGKTAQITVAMYANPVQDKAVVAGVSRNFDAKSSVGSIAMSPMARLGYNLQTMSPAVLASFVLLMIVALVSFVAHAYRKKLPRSLQRSWYRHHGLYKGVGTMVLVVMVLTLYSSGQI